MMARHAKPGDDPLNEALAERLRKALAGRRGIGEKKMFGGTCFLLHGNMLCGTGATDFMFRVGKDQDAVALARALQGWIAMAETYVAKLPVKGRK